MNDWCDVNGVSLRYELSGPEVSGSGPRTLVLIHEMGGTLETWDAVRDCFAGFRVLRYDMRGAGLSEKITTLAFDDLVTDLAGLLDHLGITGPVAIAGIAVGAAVAAAFAARHPARCEALVLMSLATGIAPERRAATAMLGNEIRNGGLRARVEQRLDATFAARFRSDEARLRAFRGRALANDPVSYAAYYDMLLGLDLSLRLKWITCPTLVLAGTEDATRPPERVAKDAAMIPGASFETVISGHVMPALTPELVAARMLAFIG